MVYVWVCEFDEIIIRFIGGYGFYLIWDFGWWVGIVEVCWGVVFDFVGKFMVIVGFCYYVWVLFWRVWCVE